jgi:hypothetical protein
MLFDAMIQQMTVPFTHGFDRIKGFSGGRPSRELGGKRTSISWDVSLVLYEDQVTRKRNVGELERSFWS